MSQTMVDCWGPPSVRTLACVGLFQAIQFLEDSVARLFEGNYSHNKLPGKSLRMATQCVYHIGHHCFLSPLYPFTIPLLSKQSETVDSFGPLASQTCSKAPPVTPLPVELPQKPRTTRRSASVWESAMQPRAVANGVREIEGSAPWKTWVAENRGGSDKTKQHATSVCILDIYIYIQQVLYNTN